MIGAFSLGRWPSATAELTLGTALRAAARETRAGNAPSALPAGFFDTRIGRPRSTQNFISRESSNGAWSRYLVDLAVPR